MSDAMTDAYRMERESTAEDTYLEALINYLHESTPSHKSKMEECMKNYGELLRGRDGLKELEEQFQKLESNNREVWKELETYEATLLFKKRPHLKQKFLHAAEKRKIGSLQWVI